MVRNLVWVMGNGQCVHQLKVALVQVVEVVDKEWHDLEVVLMVVRTLLWLVGKGQHDC